MSRIVNKQNVLLISRTFVKVSDVMKIYTKAGDTGYTSLMNETNVLKSDARIRLLGSIDELTSNLGLIKSESIELSENIEYIQQKLMQLMAHIADNNNPQYFFNNEDIELLEKNIDDYEKMIVRPKKFILPGKCKLSALLDISRTISRRVETNIIEIDKLYPISSEIKKYINRLSDYLYISARYIDFIYTIETEVTKVMQIQKPPQTSIVDMTLDIAKWLISEVEKKSIELNLSSVISVSNRAGNPVAIHCMDNSYIASFDISMNKAYTAVALKMSTIQLKAMSQPNQGLYGVQNTNNGKIIIFGGGIPLTYNNKIIGGLGVSGGTEQQDTMLAEYGEKLFARRGQIDK